MLNETRGRSYANFPRNTKEKHLQTCATALREQEQIQAQMDACYSEWAPTQIHHCAEMRDADDLEWFLGCIDSGDVSWAGGEGCIVARAAALS